MEAVVTIVIAALTGLGVLNGRLQSEVVFLGEGWAISSADLLCGGELG